MSTRDKMNMAWRLTAYTDYSKSKVATECGVAESSVANMRRVKGELKSLGKTADQMVDMTWPDAQLEAKGEKRHEIDYDTATEMRARGYARKIAGALGDRPHRDPEAFALALRMLDERLPAKLLDTKAWYDVLPEDEEDVEYEIADNHGDY